MLGWSDHTSAGQPHGALALLDHEAAVAGRAA